LLYVKAMNAELPRNAGDIESPELRGNGREDVKPAMQQSGEVPGPVSDDEYDFVERYDDTPGGPYNASPAVPTARKIPPATAPTRVRSIGPDGRVRVHYTG
jgi:hypothetical protein